jgi:hypothetical protein
MAFRGKRGKGGNDKYLRLTGLWQSKANDALWTGRLKSEQVEDLLKKVEEATEAGAPIVFSLWENDKKESKRDPEFSLQCFVGDAEDEPRSRRSSRSSGSSRRDERDDRDDRDDNDDNDNQDDNDNEEENDKEEKSSRRSSKTSKSSKGSSKKRASW